MAFSFHFCELNCTLSGKDTVMVIGDGKFQIVKINDKKVLWFFSDGNSNDVLLAYVEKYKKTGRSLYVYSKEGYALVDGGNNTCNLFLTVTKQYYGNTLTEEEGATQGITYLDSYDQFTEDEQKIFEKMKENQ